MTECRVPEECRHHVEKALLNQTQVPSCQSTDYFELLRCLDTEILTRTNVTDLNSRAGRVCCEIDEVSLPCQLACRSALFAPTLSHEQKQKRIEMVCNRNHGDQIKGDSVSEILSLNFLLREVQGVLNCLATTKEWLPQKHKLMRFWPTPSPLPWCKSIQTAHSTAK